MAEIEVSKKSEKPLLTKIMLVGVLPAMTAALLVMTTLYVSGVIPDASRSSGIDSESELLPAVYLPIDPTFVVNFSGQGNARFLQISVEVMARSPEVLEQVKNHMPVIRNNLTMLFSDQHFDTISTLEGKEKLREQALGVIQKILEKETGGPGIEAVYFTTFVMQ